MLQRICGLVWTIGMAWSSTGMDGHFCPIAVDWIMLTVVTFADLASCVYTAKCVSGKTANRGRNWNATCSLRCSFVSRKSGPLTVTTNTMTRCPNRSLLGAPLKVPFSSRNTSDLSKDHLVSSIHPKKKKEG